MAATRLIPLHVNKGNNGEKEEGFLISLLPNEYYRMAQKEYPLLLRSRQAKQEKRYKSVITVTSIFLNFSDGLCYTYTE